MTRKELAIEIAKGQVKKLGLEAAAVKRIAKGLLFGAGYARPMRLDELENWHRNLVDDGYIQA